MARAVVLTVLTGIASQYSPGVMQEVIENRQSGNAWVALPVNLPLVDGYIAVADCNELGNVWWVRPDSGRWERHLVVDCAAPNDGTLGWMITNNILLEVSYEAAVRWNTVNLGIKIEIGRFAVTGLVQ